MGRFLLQQPEALERLVTLKIGEWVVLQVEKLMCIPQENRDLLSVQIGSIQHHLQTNVPETFHDKLVTETIRALAKMMENTEDISKLTNIIEPIIEYLFSKYVTKLHLNQTHLIHAQMYETAITKPYVLTRVTTLEIDNFKYDINLLLKELHGLKVFKYQNNCKDDVLNCLVDYCKLIEEIDISYSKKVKNKSMEILIQLPNLKSVTIFKTSVSQKGVMTLLLSCKNIEHIGIDVDTSGENLIANTLRNIATSKDNVGRTFKLKYFSNVSSRSPVHLESVIRMCPLLEEITIFCPQYNYKDYLVHLNHLLHLRNLKLHNFSFYTDCVKDVLQNIGLNLVELCLVGMEIDLKALICVFEMCLNLESLSICFKQSQNSFKQISVRGLLRSFLAFVESDVKMLPLSNLKTLSLTGDQPSEKELLFLLSNCPNVEYVFVEFWIVLADNILLKVLDINPLRCLKKLRVWDSKLTKSIDRLVQNCTGLEVEYLNRNHLIPL